MFGGLEDGVAESIPALIDDELDLESLFAGEKCREGERLNGCCYCCCSS